MNIKILYEDDDLLVIDKPAGIVVNHAKSVKEETIQNWLENNKAVRDHLANNSLFKICSVNPSQLSDEEKVFCQRSGIVHRIDKETSGLLIIAKNAKSFMHLQKQFKDRIVHKKYTALVHGKVAPKKGEIIAPVGRLPWNRERFGVFPGGREAKSEYKVIDYYQNQKNDYTLVEVFPRTGRTHQIRVHLKYTGHPIAADKFYAGRKTARADREWCPRLFLHASYLRFRQPKSGKQVEVASELPEELEKVIKKLRN